MGDDTTTPEVDGLVSGSDLVWMIADCYGNVFAANATYTADLKFLLSTELQMFLQLQKHQQVLLNKN